MSSFDIKAALARIDTDQGSGHGPTLEGRPGRQVDHPSARDGEKAARLDDLVARQRGVFELAKGRDEVLAEPCGNALAAVMEAHEAQGQHALEGRPGGSEASEEDHETFRKLRKLQSGGSIPGPKPGVVDALLLLGSLAGIGERDRMKGEAFANLPELRAAIQELGLEPVNAEPLDFGGHAVTMGGNGEGRVVVSCRGRSPEFIADFKARVRRLLDAEERAKETR